MNKFIRNLRCNGDCELVYLRPFYNLDRDNIHYVCDYDEDKIGVNVFALYEENQELKKQLEEYQEEVCILDMRTDENIKYKNQQKEFIEYMKNEIYSIEPKGTGINYNCEYDSEEDYISAMKEQSKLNTLKEILSKFKEIIGGIDGN